MKLLLRPIAVWLAPLLSIAGPALSGWNSGYGADSYSGDVYTDRRDFGVAYAPDGDPYAHLGTSGRDYIQGELPDRIPNSLHEDPYSRTPVTHPYYDNRYSERLGGSGYQSYQPPDEGRGEAWYRVQQLEPPERSRYGYGAPDRSLDVLAPATGSGYRFRGDVPTYSRGWDAPPWQPSYRFRPLTEQERLRMDAEIGWRPRALNPLAEQAPRGDFLSTEEAYGYYPDNWFRRYTGTPP